MEIEYRCADGDLAAFADLHLQKPAVDARVRRSVLYGYAGFVLLLAWLYFRFGPVEFAIVLLLVGPVVIAVWPTGLRWFYGRKVLAATRALNGPGPTIPCCSDSMAQVSPGLLRKATIGSRSWRSSSSRRTS